MRMTGMKDTDNRKEGLVSEDEMSAAKFCIDYAIGAGASQARVSLNKSVLDSFSVLNGSLDKVMHSADRSIFLYLFADERYGTFSTNILDRESLGRFVTKALETVRMLAPDGFRRLPSPERTAKDAITGTETGLYDSSYHRIAAEERLSSALSGTIFREETCGNAGFRLISEECEYSDSIDDNYTIDSQGFSGRHTETSFAFCSEMTISDRKGDRYSGYWWEASPAAMRQDLKECSRSALERAVRQIGPKRHRSGRFNMIVDSNVSSRLVSPLFSALNATAIQQKNSFLAESLGRQVFTDRLTILDLARTPGKPGSRYYDTEGVATKDGPVIENGVIKEYFTNTYIAGKTGMEPTVESVSRPVLMPAFPGGRGSCLDSAEKRVSLQDLMNECGDGIYVCGFNGGNCNPVTGDFSYGIEGFAFKGGRITHPVKEMLVTGNMVRLWNNLVAAGSDARGCTRWQIPSLAFAGVDFSA